MADTPVTNEESKQPDRKKRAVLLWNIGMLISGLALVVLILSMGSSYYSLLDTNKAIASAFVDISQSYSQVQDAATSAQKSISEMHDAIQSLNDKVVSQSQLIDTLQKSQRTTNNNILVQEAQYLIKLANDSLQFENNIPLAIRLLNTADHDIASVSDPQLFTVREAISADLAKLQSAPQVDVSGLYLRLSTLNDELDKLPLSNKFVAASVKTDANTDEEKLSWWRKGLKSVWQGLQRIVIVRKNHANELPFIMPEQQLFLMQNLHAQIEQAKWGLLHHNAAVYLNSLKQVSSWIQKYISQDSPVTHDVLATIATLEQTNIEPASVNVENSWQAFQGYLRTK